MSRDSAKSRIPYAKQKAKTELERDLYLVSNSDNKSYCFLATKSPFYERKIRVVVDEITDTDLKIIKQLKILPNQTKEIWCKKFKERDWEKLAFDYLNNPCQ